MTDQLSDLHLTKRGVAILATCIVQTLDESDPTYQERFLKKLKAAYHEVRDNSEHDDIPTLELLAWTRSFLTGFSHTEGQQKPFLDD